MKNIQKISLLRIADFVPQSKIWSKETLHFQISNAIHSFPTMLLVVSLEQNELII
jgi:hypothetical protein